MRKEPYKRTEKSTQGRTWRSYKKHLEYMIRNDIRK